MRTFPPLSVGAADVATLQEWAGSPASSSVVARRARIVLLSAQGLGPTAVAAELGCSKQTVITWRERFRTDGLAGLRDAPRSGRPVSVDPTAVIERTLQEPPPRLRARRWSSRLLAAELGVSNVAVANIWRSWGVAPLESGAVRLGTEPPIDETPSAVVGAHLDAEVRLLVLTVGRRQASPSVPLRDRPRLGGRLDDLDLGVRADPGAVGAFLSALDHLPAGSLRLLVDTTRPVIERWADRRTVPVHVVPPELSWTRMVRVASVLTGRTTAGVDSVAGLRRAVLGHAAGGSLCWINPVLAANCMQ